MKKSNSRRTFLRHSSMTVAGLVLLSSTQVAKAITTVHSPYPGYNPYPKTSNDLRKFPFLGKQLDISGTVYNKKGTKVLSNTKIEVWHVSPNSTRYRHNAQFYTDTNGQYQFKTDFPNADKEKQHRIFFKVSNSKSTEFTELLFNSAGAQIMSAHWENHHLLGEKIYPTSKETGLTTQVNFNLSL